MRFMNFYGWLCMILALIFFAIVVVMLIMAAAEKQSGKNKGGLGFLVNPPHVWTL